MQTQPSRVLAFPPPCPMAINESDGALLGTSDAITRVRAQMSRVAPYFRAAVVCGETGTGAEAVARALHAGSPARELPFVTLDSAAAEQFTSAMDQPPFAEEGLLFLPDIERLALQTQHRLLRRLRQRSRPVRIVAATQTDLRAAVSAGRFSLDLADALSAIRIALPSLRERKEDLTALTITIANRLSSAAGLPKPIFDTSFLSAVIDYSWPGNLVELECLLGSLLAAHSQTERSLTAEDFREAKTRITAAAAPPHTAQTRMMRLEDIVQEHIRGVLMACHGNKLRAAEVLGISRSTLYRMLDSYTPARLPLAS